MKDERVVVVSFIQQIFIELMTTQPILYTKLELQVYFCYSIHHLNHPKEDENGTKIVCVLLLSKDYHILAV